MLGIFQIYTRVKFSLTPLTSNPTFKFDGFYEPSLTLIGPERKKSIGKTVFEYFVGTYVNMLKIPPCIKQHDENTFLVDEKLFKLRLMIQTMTVFCVNKDVENYYWRPFSGNISFQTIIRQSTPSLPPKKNLVNMGFSLLSKSLAPMV